MSGDAVGFVVRHSPFKGATYLVHLCIGDSANDQHDQEFWMSIIHLAQKSRCSRKTVYTALRELVESGCIEEVDPPVTEDGKPTGKPGKYRFLFPEMPVVFENRRRVTSTHPTRVATTHGRVPTTHGVRNQTAQSQVTEDEQDRDQPLEKCVECNDSRWVFADLDDRDAPAVPCPSCAVSA